MEARPVKQRTGRSDICLGTPFTTPTVPRLPWSCLAPLPKFPELRTWRPGIQINECMEEIKYLNPSSMYGWNFILDYDGANELDTHLHVQIWLNEIKDRPQLSSVIDWQTLTVIPRRRESTMKLKCDLAFRLGTSETVGGSASRAWWADLVKSGEERGGQAGRVPRLLMQRGCYECAFEMRLGPWLREELFLGRVTTRRPIRGRVEREWNLNTYTGLSLGLKELGVSEKHM